MDPTARFFTADAGPCSACGHWCRGLVSSSRSVWLHPRPPATSSREHRRRAFGRLQAEAGTSSIGVNGFHRPQRQRQRLINIEVQQQPQQPEPPSQQQKGDPPGVWTKYVAETLLPTKQGKFRLRGYRHTVDGGRTYTEPSVIISGKPEGLADVALRVHDACFTSEVLGSLKCDCREQLELALDYIQDHPPGMVIYLQQEGRGIGLANKIAAYALQEKGLDTVDANRALGLPDDCREYSAVRHILADLGVTSIRLMTNNPRKLAELTGLGIPVTGRIPCQVQAQQYNAGYLSSKHRRMSHLLNPEMYSSGTEDEEEQAAARYSGGTDSSSSTVGGTTDAESEELEGQFCYWEHEGEPSSAGIPLEAPVGLPDGLEGAQNATLLPISGSSSSSSSEGGNGTTAAAAAASSLQSGGDGAGSAAGGGCGSGIGADSSVDARHVEA